jgi:hypothetical protein
MFDDNFMIGKGNLGLRGPETTQWKGDEVRYRAAHMRLTNTRGRPSVCEMCGKTEGWLEWALKADAENIKIQVGGREDGLAYSTDPDDYFGTCRSCHREYDGRERDPLTGRYL